MISRSILFCCAIVFTTALTIEPEIVIIRAVKGHDARLACGQGKVFLDGPDSYVVWIKNDKDFVHRFPAENNKRRTNRDRIFGTTCDVSTCYDDTSLLIKRVSHQDSGTYRCRIHYQASPSLDNVVELMVVDSSGTPRIYNEEDEELKDDVGPLDLGSNLTLVCKVDVEHPNTLVYWRRNGAIVERQTSDRPGELQLDVFVRNADRDEHDAQYECCAQDGDVTEPLRASVVVKMNLPPIKVEIRLNNNFNFEAGQPRVVDCVVIGSVPTPTITWHLGDSQLRSSVHKELHDGNYTVSSLTLIPSIEDSKRDLVCRAHNSHLPTSVFEDKVPINVGYRPICVSNRDATVGALLAETETITCKVESSSPPLQFSWTFADSNILYTTVEPSSGRKNRYTSSLIWHPRDEDMGPVLCRAVNIFGEQKRPCRFTIAHGGPPSTPDCIVMRSFPKTIRVQCQKGWDGGRPQIIHLELYNSDGSLRHNVSNPAGHFSIPDGDDKKNMTVVVYASSSRGRSDSKVLHLQNLTPTSASDIGKDVPTPWVHWLEAAAGGLAVVGVIAGVTLCYKACKGNSTLEQNPDIVSCSDGTFHREPDFTREDRVPGTTNIVTVNQLSCKSQRCTPTSVPACRVTVDCAAHTPIQPTCPVSEHAFYV